MILPSPCPDCLFRCLSFLVASMTLRVASASPLIGSDTLFHRPNKVSGDQVLRPYQQNGKTVAIRQFNGRIPPPSTRFRAFLADGAATTGALASGVG